VSHRESGHERKRNGLQPTERHPQLRGRDKAITLTIEEKRELGSGQEGKEKEAAQRSLWQ